MSKKTSDKKTGSSVATNRKARRDYFVIDKLEAGVELKGTEVKSLREGKVSLDEAFAKIENGQVFLYELDIRPYSHGNQFNHDPRRVRRLLLHREEIKRLFGKIAIKGNALIPLRIYFTRGRAKIELGICKGKHGEDKRETLKQRTADREAARAIAAHRGRSR